MKTMTVVAASLAILLGGPVALAQTDQTKAEVKAARDQLTRDQKALEAAYKSKDLPRIKAAEDKVRGSENVLRQKRAKENREKAAQSEQAKLKAEREALKKDREALQKDREQLRQDREGRREARPDERRYREEKSEAREERRGKGKSGWAHSEKKGYGRNKDR